MIIGNPPYNANQLNENENNKNRDRIRRSTSGLRKPTSRESTAQKTKLYDMYARFFRWASDRLDENGISNASLPTAASLISRNFDGFRKGGC